MSVKVILTNELLNVHSALKPVVSVIEDQYEVRNDSTLTQAHVKVAEHSFRAAGSVV